MRKVDGYVVRNDRLLVFSHDDIPLEVVGVQVPAGTIEDGEVPETAAVREALEETNLQTRVVRALGVERYDLWPSKPAIHERHFFQPAALDADLEEQWSAGEPSPSSGGPRNVGHVSGSPWRRLTFCVRVSARDSARSCSEAAVVRQARGHRKPSGKGSLCRNPEEFKFNV